MASLLFIFFLFLPVMLMIWMMVVQRRARRRFRETQDRPAPAPWEEVIKTEGGLVYGKGHHPNEQISEAEGRADDAAKTQILGIGL
jgi:hypothetical protein